MQNQVVERTIEYVPTPVRVDRPIRGRTSGRVHGGGPQHACLREGRLNGVPGGGFTVIELMLVMLILGIAAAVVVPMASSAGTLQIRAAANMVAADLEYAKSMAISRAQKYSVIFDAPAETYRIVDQSGNVIPHPVKKGFTYTVNISSEGRLDQVDIVSASFDGTSRVSFDYLGSPYNGGGTHLNSGVITLRAGVTTMTVNVEPVTGFISVSD